MKKIIVGIFLVLCIITSVYAGEDARQQNNYFSTSVGCGATIPFGDLSPAFNIAITPAVSFSYNLAFDWGIIGFGVFSGCNIQTTGIEAAYQCLILSVPVAGILTYKTNFNSPLCLYVEANAGAAVNIFNYQAVYPGVSDSTVIKPLIAPGVGVGWRFLPWLSASAFGELLMIFYDDMAYMGISPGLRVEIDF